MIAALTWVLACLPSPASAQPVAEFYTGKQVSFLVGASAGGGYDAQARLVARHLGKHVPGNPVFVVQNMPAAGSLAATNHLANVAPRDGSVIALVQRGMLLLKLSNPAAVRFEIDKLNWIGSINSETAVTLAWHTAPHKTAGDLFAQEMVVGGIAGVDPETTPRLYNALIGTKFKIITGYPGTAEIILAMERGEVQGIADWSWSSLKKVRPDWLRDNKVRVLMQGALRKEPELPDVPSALDFIKDDISRKVLELHFTQKTVARPIIAPPGVPAERIAALRTGFMALARDREFLADAERSKIEVAPVPGEEVDKVIALIASTPPDIAGRLIKALGAGK